MLYFERAVDRPRASRWRAARERRGHDRPASRGHSREPTTATANSRRPKRKEELLRMEPKGKISPCFYGQGTVFGMRLSLRIIRRIKKNRSWSVAGPSLNNRKSNIFIFGKKMLFKFHLNELSCMLNFNSVQFYWYLPFFYMAIGFKTV